MNNSTDWLPITSAPKDGSPILLCVGDIVGSGRWRAGYQLVRYPLGFYFDGGSLPSGATHWMPLPKSYKLIEELK